MNRASAEGGGTSGVGGAAGGGEVQRNKPHNNKKSKRAAQKRARQRQRGAESEGEAQTVMQSRARRRWRCPKDMDAADVGTLHTLHTYASPFPRASFAPPAAHKHSPLTRSRPCSSSPRRLQHRNASQMVDRHTYSPFAFLCACACLAGE